MVSISIFMVFKHFQHMYSTISSYFRWVAISDNHGQKCWHTLAKQTPSIGVLPWLRKASFLLIANPPSPPFQCYNTLRGYFHLVTTLKREEGVEMSKLDIENSLVEQNGSFSESVSTTFVYDCSPQFFILFIGCSCSVEIYWSRIQFTFS